MDPIKNNKEMVRDTHWPVRQYEVSLPIMKETFLIFLISLFLTSNEWAFSAQNIFTFLHLVLWGPLKSLWQSNQRERGEKYQWILSKAERFIKKRRDKNEEMTKRKGKAHLELANKLSDIDIFIDSSFISWSLQIEKKSKKWKDKNFLNQRDVQTLPWKMKWNEIRKWECKTMWEVLPDSIKEKKWKVRMKDRLSQKNLEQSFSYPRKSYIFHIYVCSEIQKNFHNFFLSTRSCWMQWSLWKTMKNRKIKRKKRQTFCHPFLQEGMKWKTISE